MPDSGGTPRILHTMRTEGSKALSNKDWDALVKTELKITPGSAAQPADGSAAQPAPGRGWYNTCYVWSVIAMISFMEARESARQAKGTLFYVQAVGVMANVAATSPTVSQDLYRAFLQGPIIVSAACIVSKKYVYNIENHMHSATAAATNLLYLILVYFILSCLVCLT